MNQEHKMTRRQAVAGLGTTLAAVAVSPVLGADGQRGRLVTAGARPKPRSIRPG
jgi:hypothetical protein